MAKTVSYIYISSKGYVPTWVIIFTYHGWRFLLKPFGKDMDDKTQFQICKKFWILLGIFFGPLVVLLSISNFAGLPLLSKIAWIEVFLVPTSLLVIWGLRVLFKKLGENIPYKVYYALHTVINFFSKKVVWILLAVVALMALIAGVVLAFVHFWMSILTALGFIALIAGGIVLLRLGFNYLANLIDHWWNQDDRAKKRAVKEEARYQKKREKVLKARNTKQNAWYKSLKLVITPIVWIWKSILFPVLRGFAVMIRAEYKKACPLITVKRIEIK